MNPFEALASIPGFEGATVGEPLSDGISHRSFMVNRGGHRFVLRVDKPQAAVLGLNRASEWLIHNVASDNGLAPCPVYSDLRNGFSVREYASGRVWSENDLRLPQNLESLALLLQKLHAIQINADRFDPIAAMVRYSDQASLEDSAAGLDEARAIAGQIAAYNPPSCPCHNDLVHHNILHSGQLLLIDWEYAAVGDPFFDLAVVIQHHRLKENSASRFFVAYLGRPAETREIRRLDLQCRLYQLLLDLWQTRLGLDDIT
jgi:thiamine kinase-like enzyme